MCWVTNPTIVGNLYPSVAWRRIQGPGQHSAQAGQARGLRKLKLFCVESLTWKTLSSLQTVQARTIMTSVCEQRTNTRQHNLHLILCVRGSLRCQQGYNTAAALTTEHCIVTRDTWHVKCCGGVTRARIPPHTIHLSAGNWNPDQVVVSNCDINRIYLNQSPCWKGLLALSQLIIY